MSVQYSVQPLKTTPGKFFVRVEPKGTVRKQQIIQNIASSTLVSAVDIEAVLDALDDQIVDALANGNLVILDDFLGFSLSINAANPITDPNYSVTLPGDRVMTNATLKNSVRDRVRQRLATGADFEKVTVRVRQPQINRVFDVLSQQVGQYTPGGPIEITGADLDLPSDLATDTANGVFFRVGTTDTRATIYMSEGDLKIVCIVPSSVTATPVEVVVKTDYGGPTRREGKISGVTKSSTPPVAPP